MRRKKAMWDRGDIESYYTLVANPKDSDDGAIEITAGPFTGMVYKYGDFKFCKPTSENTTPKVEYKFEVLHVPEEIREVEYPQEMKDSFDQLLVNILVNMVQKDIAKEVRVEHDSTDGKGDIDESFERRVFYENDISVFKE
jgi:hypothetical protein